LKARWLLAFVGALVVFILLELFLIKTHLELPWSHIPGFFSLFGFLGCLGIIGFAKLLGHYWLQRKEDYYHKDDKHE
jgi:hypothetical protein